MTTPSQTVGPFFAIGLCRDPQDDLPNGSVRLRGRVTDADGEPVGDAMLELWDPRYGFGRAATDADGAYTFLVPAGARRFELMVFARGLLKPVLTRLYVDPEGAEDPTMVAARVGGELRFDVRLQGEQETAFFEL
jgi:protocatechuate 3,4-dioxygenase alpha subunit